MERQLRISQNEESLDPNALITPDRWNEFTTLYVQGIAQAVRQVFPNLEMDVEPALPEDRVECNCNCSQPCAHDNVLHWLNQEDNWLRGLNHALRKMERQTQVR